MTDMGSLSHAKRSSIEVSVRVRPARPELGESTTPAWDITDTTLREIANPDAYFTFDHVYSPTSSTRAVYGDCVRDKIVAHVAAGYNGTVLAYGQTGSGKTHTMFGDGTGGGGAAGMTSMAVHDLFSALEAERRRQQPPHTLCVEVFVSVLEIYNEQLRDLLAPVLVSSFSSVEAASAAASSGAPLASSTRGGKTAKPLAIRESDHGVYVHNATRRRVRTAAECLALIHASVESRVCGATAMNELSSRSHCVIRIEVEKVLTVPADGADEDEDEDEEEGEDNDANTEHQSHGSASEDAVSCSSKGRSATATSTALQLLTRQGRRPQSSSCRTLQRRYMATLNLVDLAGSERVAKTGATGLRMIEGGHINKSLTVLSTVINRLSEMVSADTRLPSSRGLASSSAAAATSAGAFIPYRDSRLTHLLKTAIGGNSFTAVVCCVTPAAQNSGESRSTLQFASRVKRIKNKVSVNELADSKVRLRTALAELRRVRKMLVAQTIYMWSKDVRIKHLLERLGQYDEQEQQRRQQGQRQPLPQYGASSSPRLTSSSDQQQQRSIVQQLTAENAALREQLATMTSTTVGVGNQGSGVTSTEGRLATNGEDEVSKLHTRLEESEKAGAELQRSLDELDALCRELEAEAVKQGSAVKELQAQCKEARAAQSVAESEREEAVRVTALMEGHLRAAQESLLKYSQTLDGVDGMSTHVGAAALLEELTRTHIAFDNAELALSQQTERSRREAAEAERRLESFVEKLQDMEDAKEEAADRNRVLNAYLRRLLSVASLAQYGRLTVSEERVEGADDAAAASAWKRRSDGEDVDAPVRDAQVTAAVNVLTNFVTSALAGDIPHHHQQHQGRADRLPAKIPSSPSVTSLTPKPPIASTGGVAREVAELRRRVEVLKEQLARKDAQREVIVDAKLKRMQALCLKLHAMNAALTHEMVACFRDNEQLFRISEEHPRVAQKLARAELFPSSLQAALERARYAQAPGKPYGHN